MNDETNSTIGRRRALGVLGALGAGAVATACGASSKSTAASTTSTTSNPSSSSAASSPLASCVTLTPEVTEGPFYLDLNDVRRDITEGRPGAPLDLKISVIDATKCTPIEGAAVDIWHCDASGVYSGFGQGGQTTFLRGTQLTDASGVAQFATIFPGFYQGRAVHIHMKVHAGGSVVHTGQLFFDPTVTKAVFQSAPYSSRGTTPDTPNTGDSIFTQAGAASAVVDTATSESGYAGQITVAVRP